MVSILCNIFSDVSEHSYLLFILCSTDIHTNINDYCIGANYLLMDNSERDANSSEDEIRRPVVKRKKKAKNTIASDTEEEEDSDIDIRPRRLTKPRRCESEDENNNDCSTSSGSKNCKFYSVTV